MKIRISKLVVLVTVPSVALIPLEIFQTCLTPNIEAVRFVMSMFKETSYVELATIERRGCGVLREYATYIKE